MARPSAALFACALWLLTPLPASAAPPPTLPQGWTQTEQELWWNSPQGSRIMPYDWFRNLERLDAPGLFAAPDHMAAYGFLPSPANALNPGALPIGFSRERDGTGGTALGMTCAACHTAKISYRGQSVLVQGTGSQADTQAFDRDLSAALSATAMDDDRFARFADRLAIPPTDRPATRTFVAEVAAARTAATRMNTPPHDQGPGRVDAQGIVLNAITATALGKPGNARTPDAPVRFPWIWNSSSYARVQYNGSLPNAGLGTLLRNIAQAIGAYGTIDLSRPPLPGYPTSVRVPELETLDALLRKLEPPAWPATLFPPIDQAKAAHGAAIYAQACASCHQARARDAARDGNGLIAVPLIPLDQIGTDPRSARNFLTREAETGVLEGRPIAVLGGPLFGAKAPAPIILGHVATAVAIQLPRERFQTGLAAFRAAPPSRLDAYKAIPLAGVWAGAPYLHNGAIASLQQLLTPAADRAKAFTIGTRDYDPALIGYPADTLAPGYILDTTLPGNGNAGHEYGTTLPETDRQDLLEFLKTL